MSIQPISAGSTSYVPPAPTSTGQATATRQVDAPQAVRETKDTSAVSQDPKSQPTSEQLTQAVKQIQDVIKQTANSLQFSIDKDSGTTVVKVVDTESKKVIRQIPSEEVMAIAKALDKLQGLLVKQQA